MLQMMLPLFYPAAVLVNVGADLLLAAAKPRWLMGLGWRPQRDFSLKALRDTYLPPALFFINMYLPHASNGPPGWGPYQFAAL